MMKLPSYFDLSGKVAIVTGGATGIGRGIAEGLADVGATIAIAARRLEKCREACRDITERTGASTLPVQCDVTTASQCDALVRMVEDAYGHIDILVNNSGIAGSEEPILRMAETDWDRVLGTNLKGIFLLSKAVVEGMARRGAGGKIINVASIASQIAWANMSAYCASKGACVQLTKVMALEWARYGIQVNALMPGYFETPMNREFFATEAGMKVKRDSSPMRRAAHIDEIRGVAVLLASGASSFMTGSAVLVDGGYTVW
jgi:NAD(P)-dependent dehydrogenase (short-subunit alcohol dehydrogenase family)